MARNLAASIARVRARIAALVFAHAFLSALAVAALATGIAVLVSRTAFAAEHVDARWSALPIGAAALFGLWRARERRLSASGAAAWLDVRSGGRGDLVHAFESGDSARPLAITDVLPRARLGRPAALALAASAFVGLSALVPVPASLFAPSIALQRAEVDRAQEKLATLEEEIRLDPEAAEDLRAQLERLEAGEGLGDLRSAFEALDGAQSALEEHAQASAEAMEAALDGLEAAAGADSAEAARDDLERALQELRKAGVEGDLAQKVEARAGELALGAQLDAAQGMQLSKEASKVLGEKLAKLAKAGLLKDRKLAKAALARIDPEALKEHVCDERCKKQPGGT